MGLHKLAAGSGYTYLTCQVAAGDDTNRGYTHVSKTTLRGSGSTLTG